MVAVDGVGEESAEGWHVCVEPLGAIGGMGMVAGLIAQVGLEVGMDFSGVVHLTDEACRLHGGEILGELGTQLLHALGMRPQRLPLCLRHAIQRMGETLIP